MPQPISLRCQTEYRIRPTVGLRKVLDGSFGRRIGHSQHPRKLEDPILGFRMVALALPMSWSVHRILIDREQNVPQDTIVILMF